MEIEKKNYMVQIQNYIKLYGKNKLCKTKFLLKTLMIHN